MKTNQGVQSEELVEEKRPFIHQSIKSRVVMMNLVCRFFDRCHGSTEQCVECQSRMKSLPVYSLITGSPNSHKLPFKRVTPLWMNKGLINPDLRLSIAFEHGLVSIPMDCYHVPHQIAIWGAYPKFKRNKHLKSVVYISHHILPYGIPIEPLFIG